MKSKYENCDVNEEARRFTLDMGADDWYDYWHTHVDWDGDGNKSIAARKKYISALFIIFDRLVEQSFSCPLPNQIWICVGGDSAEDAVYFHTPNPNNDNFPDTFEDLNMDVGCPLLLQDYFDPKIHRIGNSRIENKEFHFIFRR